MNHPTLRYMVSAFSVLVCSIGLHAQYQEGHKEVEAPYRVQILESLGGSFSSPNGINNHGLLMGVANLPGDQAAHAVVWRQDKDYAIKDLGTLGGPNSGVNWSVNDNRGIAVGASDTSTIDPNGENFCNLSPTGSDLYVCLGFAWQNGPLMSLPTLGGNNSYAFEVNNRGQVAGIAETGTPDPSCTPPQVLDWEAVIWGPRPGEIQQLPLLPGDTVGAATAINSQGTAVGTSGPNCTSVSSEPHAVLWEKGSVTNLGSLGGLLENIAFGINDQGQVVGFSDLPGDTTTHAFLWTKENGMQDLGTLPGDINSYAYGINSKGQVVGDSNGGSYDRAFLWQDGVMVDLNSLIPPNSNLYLLVSNQINDRGEIACMACVFSNGACTSEMPPVVLIPTHGEADYRLNSRIASASGNPVPKVIIPEDVREQLHRRMGFRQQLRK